MTLSRFNDYESRRRHPIRACIVVMIILMVPGLTGAAIIERFGNLSANETWTAGNTYHITGTFTVDPGVTLTVQAGAVVKLEFVSINVQGTLNVAGSMVSPVVITADEDESVGEDVDPPTPTTPNPGEWVAINVTGTATMNHVDLRYGGDTNFSPDAIILADAGSSVNISNCIVSDSESTGIRAISSNPTISNCDFVNNVAAMRMDVDANPSITAVTFTNNATNGVAVDSGTTTVDTAFDDPDVIYRLTGGYTVGTGNTLTVTAGQIIKANFVSLNVDGTLNATGTMGNPVIFTSDEDDEGGDTNNDGPSMGGPGDWTPMSITGAATMSFVEVRFGGDTNFSPDANIFVDTGASLSIDNCVIHASEGAGIRMNQANPVITDCHFSDSLGPAMRMDVDSNPNINGPTFANNSTNGVAVDSGTTTTATAFDDPDVIYRLTGTYTVGASQTLTVTAGQIIKANFVSLNVNGTLNATGTMGNPVIFTSDEDDEGGDTNNDGPSVGGPGDWTPMSITGAATMSFVEVRFGGDTNFSPDANIFVDTGASLSIDNCVIHASEDAGIRMNQADAVITDCHFSDSLGPAVRMDVDSNPTITGPTFSNNATNGVAVDSGTTTVDTAFDDPDVIYRLTGTYTVGVGNTLTVTAGQIVKANFVSINIDGTINVTGSMSAPVIFTSDEDDENGDTNNDGPSSGSPGDWFPLSINGSATMDFVEIRFGGDTNASPDAILFANTGASLNISNCLIHSSEAAGIRAFESNPVITNCTFTDNIGHAILVDVTSDPTVTTPSFTNNGTNGLLFNGGTLPGDSIWDNPDVVMVLGSAITVPAGSDLTIGAGQHIKPLFFSSLNVEGTLSTLGTIADPVVFTSFADDQIGGDTDNTGPSVGGPGHWMFIDVNGGIATLDNTVLRFGGDSNNSIDAILNARNNGMLVGGNIIIEASETAALACDTSSQLTFAGLIASGSVHGVRAFGGCTADIVNATIDSNTTGVAASASTVNLTNAIISFSSSRGLNATSGGDISLLFSDLFNPDASSGEVFGIPDPIGVNGNISGDPAYVQRSAGDYRLLGHSAAIDAGTSNGVPPLDIFGNDRFDNIMVANTGAGAQPFVDIGAIERQDGIPGALLRLADNADVGDRFGSAVAAIGNRLAVGIPNADVDGVDDGQVLIFELVQDRFELAATIDVPDGFFAVNFGAAIALDGNEILIGAPGTSASSAKHRPQAKQGAQAMQAALFQRLSQTDWRLKTPLAPMNGNADDQFGAAVSLSGDTMIVGAPGDAEGGVTGGGAAHVFQVDGSSVAESLKLKPFTPIVGAGFGTAVASSGNMMAVGAPGDTLLGVLSGTASLYNRISDNLSNVATLGTVGPSQAADSDRFGHSVALAGGQMMVGAPMTGADDSGAAFVFEAGGSLRELARLTPSDPSANGHAGMAVALDGGEFVAGMPGANAGAGAVLRFDLTFRQIEQIDGPANATGFGQSLARRGNLLAIGAPDANSQEGTAFAQLRDALLAFSDDFE